MISQKTIRFKALDTFENAYFFFPNRPSVHRKPVNPHTETAYFWNRSPESRMFWIRQVWWILLADWNLIFFKSTTSLTRVQAGPGLNENVQVQKSGQQCSVSNFCGSYRQSYCLRWNKQCFAMLTTKICYFLKRRRNFIQIVGSFISSRRRVKRLPSKPRQRRF